MVVGFAILDLLSECFCRGQRCPGGFSFCPDPNPSVSVSWSLFKTPILNFLMFQTLVFELVENSFEYKRVQFPELGTMITVHEAYVDDSGGFDAELFSVCFRYQSYDRPTFKSDNSILGSCCWKFQYGSTVRS